MLVKRGKAQAYIFEHVNIELFLGEIWIVVWQMFYLPGYFSGIISSPY